MAETDSEFVVLKLSGLFNEVGEVGAVFAGLEPCISMKNPEFCLVFQQFTAAECVWIWIPAQDLSCKNLGVLRAGSLSSQTAKTNL